MLIKTHISLEPVTTHECKNVYKERELKLSIKLCGYTRDNFVDPLILSYLHDLAAHLPYK